MVLQYENSIHTSLLIVLTIELVSQDVGVWISAMHHDVLTECRYCSVRYSTWVNCTARDGLHLRPEHSISANAVRQLRRKRTACNVFVSILQRIDDIVELLQILL